MEGSMDKSRLVSGITGHAPVLGGSGGLGAEIVRTLAASGASAVSFTYGRNKKAADDLITELRADGIKALAAPADLSDEPGFNKVLDDAVASIGDEISLAINSIVISPNIPIEEASSRTQTSPVYSPRAG
jgi:NAD(P)-dependent dehydrogenase (short-subunit alcohol dehydrogenase family)